MARAMRLDGDALRQCISTMTTRRPSVPKPDRRIETDPTQRPGTLDECRRCPLWHDATQGVGGVGPAHAAIMMVGEQPGDSEDREGRPFVGPAGRLLDDALREAGVTRGTVFVTNAVKHFKWEPRGKRRMHKTPAQREVDACRYWLERELTRVSPRVVVALGSTALKALLQDAHVYPDQGGYRLLQRRSGMLQKQGLLAECLRDNAVTGQLVPMPFDKDHGVEGPPVDLTQGTLDCSPRLVRNVHDRHHSFYVHDSALSLAALAAAPNAPASRINTTPPAPEIVAP